MVFISKRKFLVLLSPILFYIFINIIIKKNLYTPSHKKQIYVLSTATTRRELFAKTAKHLTVSLKTGEITRKVSNVVVSKINANENGTSHKSEAEPSPPPPNPKPPKTRFSRLVYSNLSCPENPPSLVGEIVVNKTTTDLRGLEETLPRLYPIALGGTSSPSACLARHRVAIIVPYRDRAEHLPVMLRHLHPFLIKQQLHYRIFVVEQTPKGNFNKALMFNVGVREVERRFPGVFTCVVLQDVDILPENDHISYGCSEKPRHFALLIDRYNYRVIYTLMTGGAFEIDIETFKWINGFSNQYYGWGGEDDDFAHRMLNRGIKWQRFPKWSRFASLSHTHHKKNPSRQKILNSGRKRQAVDGYNSAAYKINDYKEYPLYTNISTELTILNVIDYMQHLNLNMSYLGM